MSKNKFHFLNPVPQPNINFKRKKKNAKTIASSKKIFLTGKNKAKVVRWMMANPKLAATDARKESCFNFLKSVSDRTLFRWKKYKAVDLKALENLKNKRKTPNSTQKKEHPSIRIIIIRKNEKKGLRK
jgi:hypothetical protein